MTTLSARRIDQAKDALLSASGSVPGMRPDLVTSWQRSKRALGDPSKVRDVPQVAAELLDRQLLEMFQAPLARVSDELDGTGLGLLLADAEGRILQRWTHDHEGATHLDRLGTVRGAVLSEAVVGTNGVGTVAATGRSVQIAGNEHFADFYRSAICTGAPVRHPLTGCLLAVVTISSRMTERADLLKPLTSSIATRLGQHLVAAERPAARKVLTAFLAASRMHNGPIVAFGPDGFLMQNRRAARLTANDLELLRRRCSDALAVGQDEAHTGRTAVALSGGMTDIQLTRLDGGSGALAVVVDSELNPRRVPSTPARPALAGRCAIWLDVAQTVARHRESRTPLVISGESGVGKTSLALGRPYWPGSSSATSVVDAAGRHVVGAKRWLRGLSKRLESDNPVIVRGVDTLEGAVISGMKSLIDIAPGRGAVLLTLTAESRDLAEAAGTRLGYPAVWVPALRERADDLALLWRELCDHLAPSAQLKPTQDAREALQAYAWPGNIVELRNIIEQLAMGGRCGAVTESELPTVVRNTRSLSMIERAELEAIQRALQEADGNRSRAAELLGLSRATVYRKMKTYRLLV